MSEKKIFLKSILLSGFIFLISGCTSLTGKKENVSIVNAPAVKPAPSVIDPPPSSTTQTPIRIVLTEKDFEKILSTLKEIEDNFISQNCSTVLDLAKSLDKYSKTFPIDSYPTLSQAAVYVCDAKAGLDNPNRLHNAIAVLKATQLRYPIINEAWLKNTISDFYIALGEKDNALTEKRVARDLILAQQLDISSLNSQILQLNPQEPGLQMTNSGALTDAPNQTIDQIVSSAKQMLDNDSPEQALALIDTIPNDKRSDSIKRLRSDAEKNLVMNLRFKVRALFVRASQQTGATRKDTLSQCLQILQGIIKNYPGYSDMLAVQNNLKQVQREMSKP
ncbi:hypothetical protein [Fluviispira multicolorata]|uniref:Lipoprotein n=1 Tax=Fluviispira multicolorata TaxID=2654512 RepID=A0A833JEC2_9BACT|nr:hypothetical protein [Fluviispira multicolorata]KAB8029799.1 hypothetical protein GCL57_09670 [Fluviispira multicolorata]